MIKVILAGLLAGLVTGIMATISDGIFYSKYGANLNMAKKYSSITMQLTVFMFISLVYGVIQSGIFNWVLPILPPNNLLRGIVFGIASFLLISRHFVEGFAFMNTKFMPIRVSVYLSIEFFFICVFQGLILSFVLS